MDRRAWWVGAVLLSLVAGPAPADAQMPCAPCTVGVVLDGPWERNDEIRGIFEREVFALAADEFEVRFPETRRRVGDWSFDAIAAAVDAVLADPEVDLVLTLGPVASTYAARDAWRAAGLTKPLVAAFVLNPDVLGIPSAVNDVDERVSGVDNLAYVEFPADIEQNVRRLRELAPFRRLTFLTSAGLAEAVPELEANLITSLRTLEVEPAIVRVGASIEAALAALPDATDAVYVMPLLQLPPEAFDRLVEALIARRLPSFSYWGRREVERGLLATLFADEGFDRLGRRIALHVQRILRGENPARLPVGFARRQRPSLNIETAEAIGTYPSWDVLTELEIVGDSEQGTARRLNLAQAAREAVAANLDLRAAARRVSAGDQERRIARAARYPQLLVGGVGQAIDRDRAASLTSGPQRLGVAAATVSQLIYSDQVSASIEIQDDVQQSRVAELAETRLDVVRDATVAYLDVLRAETFETIQRDNLGVTRSNLDLARIRRDVGVARPTEVIRWETEVANNRRSVITASAQRNVAEIQLNRLLDRPLEEPFLTEEAGLDDPELRTSWARLSPYLANPYAFDLFRDFMSTEALAIAPELRRLDAAVRAQERALVAARRAFWAPRVALNGELATVAAGGAGTAIDLGELGTLLPPAAFERPNALNWTVDVSASLPIFTGGARRAEQARAAETLEELRVTRRAVAQQIEQRLRSALHVAGASHAGIALAEAAADAARRNLLLVTDAYEQGTSSILDLLDAQNQARVADEVAASAIFDYLIDVMRVQRAIGRFDFFIEPERFQAFLDRLQRFFDAAGYVRPARP